jgi:hypothetical protein
MNKEDLEDLMMDSEIEAENYDAEANEVSGADRQLCALTLSISDALRARATYIRGRLDV